MAVASKILGADGRPYIHEPKPVHHQMRARYDAAQTTNENNRHWSVADALGPASANVIGVRKKLRERARYEVANNSIAKGLELTCANDLIGTGPSLQVLTDSKSNNQTVERRFAEWFYATQLPDKLRSMSCAEFHDGEPFAFLTNNPGLPTDVQLDVQPFECDYVDEPWAMLGPSSEIREYEGIRYDKSGNPIAYHIYNEHPGDSALGGMKGQWFPARMVIHYFRKDRPGQLRGIPKITPALPLFACLRRFTLAVIAAAETAADFAGVMSTDQVPDGGVAQLVNDFDTQEIARRMLVSLPPGYKLQQMVAEQPCSTYAMFKREVLTEIARCLNMPYSIAAGDSSDSSYAGGRQEFQSWDMSIRVERSQWEVAVLDRIFDAWLDEAIMIPGYLPVTLDIANLPHAWFWDSRPHVDPSKEAAAFEKLLAINGATLTDWWASKGKDFEDVARIRAKEIALLKELGLPTEAVKPNKFAPAEEEEEDAPVRPTNRLHSYGGVA